MPQAQSLFTATVDEVLQLALRDVSRYEVLRSGNLPELLRLARRSGYAARDIQQIHGTRYKAQITLAREHTDMPAPLISDDTDLTSRDADPNAVQISYLLALPKQMMEPTPELPQTPLESAVDMAIKDSYIPREIVQTWGSGPDGHIALYRDGRQAARIVFTQAGPIIVDRRFLIAHIPLISR